MSADDRLDRLFARQAIADLRHEYCRHVDDGDFDAWADLFVSDAVLDIEGRDSVTGREAIRRLGTDVIASDYAHSAHLVCNPLVDVGADDRATGQWSLLLWYELPDGTVGWRQGRYDETYVRTGERWRFETIRATFGVGGTWE